MNLTVVLFIVIGVVGAGAAAEGFLLKRAYERNGALEISNKALQNKLTEVNNVLKQVDQTHSTNVALPDDKLFDGLLPVAPGP